MTLSPDPPIASSALLDWFTHLNGHSNYSLGDGSDAFRSKLEQVQKTQINYMQREPRLHRCYSTWHSFQSIPWSHGKWICVSWEVEGGFPMTNQQKRKGQRHSLEMEWCNDGFNWKHIAAALRPHLREPWKTAVKGNPTGRALRCILVHLVRREVIWSPK